MSVSEEVYQTVNASKHAVRMPKELGGGRQALLETIHQLHCLVSYLPQRNLHRHQSELLLIET